MPAMFVVFAFIEPVALVIYFIVSNVYRVGMQAYITRTGSTTVSDSAWAPRLLGPRWRPRRAQGRGRRRADHARPHRQAQGRRRRRERSGQAGEGRPGRTEQRHVVRAEAQQRHHGDTAAFRRRPARAPEPQQNRSKKKRKRR